MFNLVYKSVVVECSTGVEDLAKAIEKKSEEMLNKGYKLVTMSMVGTDKIIAITQQSRMRISFKQICRVRFETTGSKGTQAELEMCKCSQYAYVAALFFFTKIEVSYRI